MLYKFNSLAAHGFDFEAFGLIGFIRIENTPRHAFALRIGKVSPHSRTWRFRLALGRFTLYFTPDAECPTHC